jgi:hypothetical protein
VVDSKVVSHWSATPTSSRSPERIADVLELFHHGNGSRTADETDEDVDPALGSPSTPPQRRADPAEVGAVAPAPVTTEV